MLNLNSETLIWSWGEIFTMVTRCTLWSTHPGHFCRRFIFWNHQESRYWMGQILQARIPHLHMPLPQTHVFVLLSRSELLTIDNAILHRVVDFFDFGLFWLLLLFSFFVFRKFLSTLFVFCSKYLSELHSRLRYFRWRAKFVFWRVSWSLLLAELYSSIWRRCGR